MTETIHAGQEREVLGPCVDEADVCRHPDEESNRQNEECKHVETVAELGRLGDQGQRDGEAQSIDVRIRRRYLAPKALEGPIEAALRASDDVTLMLTPTAWRSGTAPIVDSPERPYLAVDA